MHEQNVILELADADDQPVSAELSIRRDTVEIRCAGRQVAVQDRDQLKAWLAKPDGLLTCDEMSWLCAGWAISVRIDGLVPVCILGWPVVDDLRRHLR